MAETSEDDVCDMHQHQHQMGHQLMPFLDPLCGGVLAETPQDLWPVLVHLADGFRRDPENAARLRVHAPTGARLISRISIVNGGPALPAGKLETLKARFVRGRTHARGSGLGLAIAETIAAGAGARLDLISPATGRTSGFEAVLHLSA